MCWREVRSEELFEFEHTLKATEPALCGNRCDYQANEEG